MAAIFTEDWQRRAHAVAVEAMELEGLRAVPVGNIGQFVLIRRRLSC